MCGTEFAFGLVLVVRPAQKHDPCDRVTPRRSPGTDVMELQKLAGLAAPSPVIDETASALVSCEDGSLDLSGDVPRAGL